MARSLSSPHVVAEILVLSESMLKYSGSVSVDKNAAFIKLRKRSEYLSGGRHELLQKPSGVLL